MADTQQPAESREKRPGTSAHVVTDQGEHDIPAASYGAGSEGFCGSEDATSPVVSATHLEEQERQEGLEAPEESPALFQHADRSFTDTSGGTGAETTTGDVGSITSPVKTGAGDAGRAPAGHR